MGFVTRFATKTRTKKGTEAAAKKAAEKAAKAAAEKAPKQTQSFAVFSKPSVEPIATQAGRMGIPVTGSAQMAAAHPSRFGPYATISPRIAQKDLRVGYEPMVDMEYPKTFSLDNLENSLVLPLVGDRTIAGKRIVSINGMPVDVNTYGGPYYGEFNRAMDSPAVWASAGPQISGLQNIASKGFDEGRDVYGFHVAMSPRSADQTTMMTDLLTQQIPQSEIMKKDLKAFDRLARTYIPKFPGIAHPEAQNVLENSLQGQRKLLVEQMDKASFLKAGFPDVSAARAALTEKGLLKAPSGSSGLSVVKFSPESLKPMNVTLRHPTYDTQMAGEPMGGLSHLVPFDMLFPDFVAQRRAAGLSAGKDLRSLEFSKPSQVMRQKDVDRLRDYIDKVRKVNYSD
jgi:hypothetical protein